MPERDHTPHGATLLDKNVRHWEVPYKCHGFVYVVKKKMCRPLLF